MGNRQKFSGVLEFWKNKKMLPNNDDVVGTPVMTCPLGDRHGIDLLNSIHVQLGTMSTQLIHVIDTSEQALVSVQRSDDRINELKFIVHTLSQEIVSLKTIQSNFRQELDMYRKGVFASAVACLLGLLSLIGMAIKDHFGFIIK